MAVAAEVDQPDTEPETVEPVEESETEPDEDETGEDEDVSAVAPEPETAPESALSEKQLNAALAKLDREATRHRDRLTEIMGEDALMLTPCPVCEPQLGGWRYPIVPTEEQWRDVTAAIFGEESVTYADAAYVKACPECVGLGQIATHSKVPGRASIDCRACNGFGYVTEDTPALGVLPPVEPAVPVAGFGPPTEPAPDADPWGRPRHDPNYGRMPGYEV